MTNNLIIGAGKLGKRFYHYLISKSENVITLSRSPKPWSHNHIQLDLLSETISEASAFNIDRVFIILAPNQRDKEAYSKTYIDAVENVLTALNKVNTHYHCTFLSSTSVYGSEQKGVIDESTAANPNNFRGEILLEAEQNLKRLCRRFSIVRASGLYSKERKRFVDSMLDKEKAEDPKWLNMIHEDDLCQWLEAAANKQWPLSIASDGEPLQRSQLHSLEIDMTNYRQFKSQYLHQLSLKHSSFTDWLKCQ